MTNLLPDLIRHKAHADAALFSAIYSNDVAARDEQILNLLHHILVANRFWLSMALGEAFSLETESRRPETLAEIGDLYRQTHAKELEWIGGAGEANFERTIETEFIPGKKFTAAEGMMQVCLHSQGHRAQCGVRLRALGGTPPGSDFIWWLRERPTPHWP